MAKLSKFEQSVLDNRLRLINAEPAVDALVAKRMKEMYAKWEAELINVIGSKSTLSKTHVAELGRKMNILQGRFKKITQAQVNQIQKEIGKIAKSTFDSEAFTHTALIDNHIHKFQAYAGVSLNGLNRKAMDAAYRQKFAPGYIKHAFGKVPPVMAKKLRRDIADAIAKGWKVDELAKHWKLMHGAAGATKNAMQATARTMVMQASSNAQLHAYTSQPEIIKGVQWEATFDSRTCPVCAGRHGRQYPRNEAPSQPAHLNCRCAWMPVFIDETLNTKLDTRTAYIKPINNKLTYKKQTREFEGFLKRSPLHTQRDFFGSRLKMKAWRAGRIDLRDMTNMHGTWITDTALLKYVHPAWAKIAVKNIDSFLGPAVPKNTPIPKGQLQPPFNPNPPKVAKKPPSPITLDPDTAQTTIGTVPQVTQAVKPLPTPKKAPKPVQVIEKPKVAPTVEKLTEAVTDKPGAVLDVNDMKQIGPQAGSNPGGLYQDANGQKWYIKETATEAHASNEIITAKLYEALGVKVPELRYVKVNGKHGVASKWKDDLEFGKFNAGSEVASKDFAIDAYLANWDVVGLNYDNIAQMAGGGTFRLDTGGGLLFRAQGAAKGKMFKSTIDEIESLRNPAINPQSAKVFAKVTDDDLIDGLERIANISNSDLIAIVNNSDIGISPSLKSDLFMRLFERKEDATKRLKILKAKKIGTQNVKPLVVKQADEIAEEVVQKIQVVKAVPEEQVILKLKEPLPVKKPIKIEAEPVEFYSPNHTPQGMPKGAKKQFEKYGYDFKSTGVSGHKRVVSKAENGDIASMVRLIDRAARGMNNELPDLKRAKYWLDRVDEIVLPKELFLKVEKLRKGIEHAEANGAYFIPTSPATSGAKKFVKMAKEVFEDVDIKTGSSDLKMLQVKIKQAKAEIAAQKNLDAATISKPMKLSDEELIKKLKDPKLDGIGPIASDPQGAVLKGNTGDFYKESRFNHGIDFDKLRDGGGIRANLNTYYQRIETADGSQFLNGKEGIWVKWTRESSKTKWTRQPPIHKGIPNISDWNSIQAAKPTKLFKPTDPDAISQAVTKAGKKKKKQHTAFSIDKNPTIDGNFIIGDSDYTGMALNKPLSFKSTKFQDDMIAGYDYARVNDDVLEGIRKFTGSYSDNMRDVMSSDKAGRGEFAQYVKAMSKYIKQAPRHNSLVHRGIKRVPIDDAVADYQVGNKVYYNAHASSSVDTASAFEPIGDGVRNLGVRLEIEGSRKVHVQGISSIEREKESFILAYTEYEVLSVKRFKTFIHVKVKETGLNDDALRAAARERLHEQRKMLSTDTATPDADTFDEFTAFNDILN